MKRTVVAVLAGGPDAERPVSLSSGREVAAALRQCDEFDVRFVEIDRLTASELSDIEADVIFPVLHGPWGEGGPLQRLLESDGRPFVTSGSRAAALGMDKVASKRAAEAAGVRTPAWAILDGPDSPCPIDPPLVLKPIDDGSSVDVAICRTQAEANAARRRIQGTRGRLLVERFIPGRELTVGIVEDRVSSLIEIIPAVEFYDYEAKYERDDTRYVVEPELPAGVDEAIRDAALRVFEAIGARDLSRVDFRFDPAGEGDTAGWWFLEINTIPGFTSHSLVPMGALAGGVAMPELCRRLVRRALARGRSSRAGAVGAA